MTIFLCANADSERPVVISAEPPRASSKAKTGRPGGTKQALMHVPIVSDKNATSPKSARINPARARSIPLGEISPKVGFT